MKFIMFCNEKLKYITETCSVKQKRLHVEEIALDIIKANSWVLETA